MKESEIIKALNELTNMLGNNLKSIKYDKYNDIWIIKYNSDLTQDEVQTDDLIDFVQNA